LPAISLLLFGIRFTVGAQDARFGLDLHHHTSNPVELQQMSRQCVAPRRAESDRSLPAAGKIELLSASLADIMLDALMLIPTIRCTPHRTIMRGSGVDALGQPNPAQSHRRSEDRSSSLQRVSTIHAGHAASAHSRMR